MMSGSHVFANHNVVRCGIESEMVEVVHRLKSRRILIKDANFIIQIFNAPVSIRISKLSNIELV